ncbi:small ribosomal subunit protein uS5m [Antennarius striatus]|uniref:small ribosomal subunit protein uS5m n=1 Tax=Antennarius striatus TaxID=241820 RepID=UPI0035B28EE7
MAASVRMFCALRIATRGSVPFGSACGVVQVTRLACRVSVTSLLVNPRLPAWQQSRHGSFFNKLTAEELWKGMLAETGAGSRSGRGKRGKRKVKKDLNRGQRIGEGRAGFLWPGLNIPVTKHGILQPITQRNDAERQEAHVEMLRFRDEWEKRLRTKVKKERGWTGHTWGGISLNPPDPGPNQETYEDFQVYVLEVKNVFTMTAKEGRKKTVSCLVATGNGKGAAGFALGKSADRRTALRKAKNKALRYLYYVERYNDHSIYHDIVSKFKKTTLHMKKQHDGYGLHCHRAIITLCKLIGIKNMYCKVEGSTNILNITKALFKGLTNQETHQTLADKKRLHVVEFQPQRDPLPIVVASPTDETRLDPEPEDQIPNNRLDWRDIKAAQGFKRSVWANVKRSVY